MRHTSRPAMTLSVSVFGLGYVGCVSAACLAKEGHTVVGVDVSAAKVDLINAGQATIIEDGIRKLVSDMRATGRLSATAEAGAGFGLCVNPEFLREGTSIRDFYEPPFNLIGAADAESAGPVYMLYLGIDTPTHVVPIKVAEMVKYACNAYHGLKISFANEIGNICKALTIDSHEVMRLFCEDTKLNVSAAYLKPGFAFGGSCLPKDLRALSYRARQADIDTPLLAATLESNRKQIQRAFDMVIATGARKVGVLGLSFKAGTDDLRESPMVSLVELLYGKGMTIAIHD